MPPPPDLSSYRLSDAESQRIFQEQILPAAFPASASPSTRRAPLAVLAVGQTGAGKTLLAPAILRALASSSSSSTATPAHLIADTFKTYHPAYAQLPPAHASPATGPDARRWLALAAAEAARRRVDVVLESACRHPDDFCALAALFRAARYRVEVVVLAVPAALSRLGVLSRFHAERPEARPPGGAPPRLTPVRVHDDAYAGLLGAAAFLDGERRVADQVLVVRRGGWVAHGWERAERGGAAAAPGIASALERERGRRLTEEERRVAMADVAALEAHEEARELLEQVKVLLEPLMRDGAQDETYPPLEPLEFAQKDGDKRGSNVLRLGYA